MRAVKELVSIAIITILVMTGCTELVKSDLRMTLTNKHTSICLFESGTRQHKVP